MSNEDYVSYEIAKRLKALGFDYPCYFYYTEEDAPDGCVWHTTSEEAPIDYNRSIYAVCSMPTLAQAQKWLISKGGYIDVQLLTRNTWSCAIENEYGNELLDVLQTWDTYESALSAGIEAALKLIEEDD